MSQQASYRARLGKSENSLSIRRLQSHTTNLKKKKRKQYCRRQKVRADKDNRKSLALILKPTSTTPSNTESLRSFQRDTERGTKGLRYWEVQQRGGTKECLWTTKAQRVTRSGTYGKGNAPLRKCIGQLSILNSMNNTATDRRWETLHSKTPPSKKTELLTILSSMLIKVWIGSWARHCWAILQDRQDKAPKRSQKEWPIMKYLPGLFHNTEPLSCSSVCRAKVLPKGYLSVKRHPQ